MPGPTSPPDLRVSPRPATRGRVGAATLLLLALLVQAWSLYRSAVPEGAPSFAHADKIAHLLLFAVPAALAVLVGGRLGRVVLVLLVVHAPVSEVVQGRWLDQRSGDPWDVVANLVGVVLGAGAGWALTRRRGRTGPVDVAAGESPGRPRAGATPVSSRRGGHGE